MLRGKIERIDGNLLIGWLWDPNSIEPVEFELKINGISFGIFRADLLRADLKRKAIGSGSHAFRIELGTNWSMTRLNRFTVLSTSDGTQLGRDLITYSLVASGPNARTALLQAETIDDLRESIMTAFTEICGIDDTVVRELADKLPRAERNIRRPLVRKFQPLKPRVLSKDAISSLDWIQQRDLLRTLIDLGKIPEKQIASLVESAMKSLRSSVATILGEAVEGAFPPSYRILNNVGRAYLQLGDLNKAAESLEKLRSIEPSRHAAIFYLGVTYARQQKYSEAYAIFLECASAQPTSFKYQLEAARAAVLVRFGGYGVFQERPEFLDKAMGHFEAAARLDAKDPRLLREYARVLVHADRTDDALALAKRATDAAPKNESGWSDLSRIYLQLGRIDDALEASHTAQKLSPNNDGTKFAVRILTRLHDTRRHGLLEPKLAIVGGAGEPVSSERLLIRRVDPPGPDIEAFLSALDEDWICFDPSLDLDHEGVSRLASRLLPWAAGAEIALSLGTVAVWRRDFLVALLQSGARDTRAGTMGLLALAARRGVVVPVTAPPMNLAGQLPSGGVVFLISQYGIYKFGGVEQFLSQMARIYIDLGFQVLLVGTRSEHVGQSGTSSGLRYTFIDGSPEELLRLALEEDAAVVHVVSGLGFEIASALRYLDVRLVFGVHFWRELFFNPTPSSGYFPDIDRKATPRPDFKIIADDFHGLYSNSVFTRQVVERHFGLRTPIIYSLPDDADGGVTIPFGDRDCVLLVNARADKGFDLTVDIALTAPEVRFLAIASQSGLAAAEAVLAERGARNVEVISRADDMPALYRRARVVLVPSFRFVETFSRVVIEAHRFGVPVIGSDRGNVPHLLTESGGALAEDADLWAAEVRRLWTDEGHWIEMSRRALDNSERYRFSAQKGRLSGLLSSLQTPLLVGVGSGLGNVIHTTPLIRNLAIRLGRRVDVVVAGDYADLLFVTAKENYVNHVMLLNDVTLRRRYDTVFLTHSFGSVTPAFAATRVVSSRSWDNFAGDHPLHEAEFNLAAAHALLDVTYDEEDVSRYYLGDFAYTPPATPLVGMHGGSKGGIWASKRWPHYADLARELTKRGIPVASFGTSDEYVDGTIDMTGGSIEEMARRMLACSAFVANDSGVMNVANALGIPLLALFGPTNVATRGPLASTSRSISIDKPCAPCEIHETERRAQFLEGTCRCIEEIDTSEALSALLSLARASLR